MAAAGLGCQRGHVDLVVARRERDGERLDVELEPAQIDALIKKNRTSFDSFARALQALGVEAVRASDAQNPDMLIDIGERIDNVCESCHQVFWYPPA